MRRSTLRLAAPALAAALLLGVTAGPAAAYFTASDVANGGVVIKGPDTDITEVVGDGEKDITIHNNEDSVPVWVRAKAFIAEELKPGEKAAVEGENWTELGDGWWQYNDYLEPGEDTATPLVVNVEWAFKGEKVDEKGLVSVGTSGSDQGGQDTGKTDVVVNRADGTNYNIVVVYECTPVKFGDDGVTPVTPVEWRENN